MPSHNGHGGKRQGSGRKPNALAKVRVELPDELDAVTYMQQVYMDETQPVQVRMDAAKAAAPYERPRWAPKPIEDTATADQHIALIEKLHDDAMKAHDRANGKA